MFTQEDFDLFKAKGENRFNDKDADNFKRFKQDVNKFIDSVISEVDGLIDITHQRNQIHYATKTEPTKRFKTYFWYRITLRDNINKFIVINFTVDKEGLYVQIDKDNDKVKKGDKNIDKEKMHEYVFKNINIPAGFERKRDGYGYILEISKDTKDYFVVMFKRLVPIYREILKKFSSSNNKQSKNNENKILNPKNIILYGPPGTGKTYVCKYLIAMLDRGNFSNDIFKYIAPSNEDEQNSSREYFDIHKKTLDTIFEDIKNNQDRYEFITFHQSYSYEDFIKGYKPVIPDDNSKTMIIEPRDGIFKIHCDVSQNEDNKDYSTYFVIDEINRGNISKIFGELITLIEEDKRLDEDNELNVSLPYSEKDEKDFCIPSNVYIIGTMNTADKSIANIDVALRRRFTFVRIDPRPDLIKEHDIERKEGWSKIDNDGEPANLREWFVLLNKYIETQRSRDFQIGHSYFMNITNNTDLQFVLDYKIKPLMEEYFYHDNDVYKKIMAYCEIELVGGIEEDVADADPGPD